MTSKDKIVYKSRIDWWVWCIIIFTLGFIVAISSLNSDWIFALIFGGGMAMLFVVGLFGCWYEIENDQLIVYQFFRPHKFPINKIKEVKKTVGYLATAGMSRLRVSIKFVNRSVMKSAMPLEISPKDRDIFIAQLKQINPEIAVE